MLGIAAGWMARSVYGAYRVRRYFERVRMADRVEDRAMEAEADSAATPITFTVDD